MVRGLGNPHHSVQEAFEEFGDDGLHIRDSRTGQRGWELTEARNPGETPRRGEEGQKPSALRTRGDVYTEVALCWSTLDYGEAGGRLPRHLMHAFLLCCAEGWPWAVFVGDG